MIGLKANNVPMYPNVMDMFIFAFGTWFRWIAIRFFHLLSTFIKDLRVARMDVYYELSEILRVYDYLIKSYQIYYHLGVTVD